MNAIQGLSIKAAILICCIACHNFNSSKDPENQNSTKGSTLKKSVSESPRLVFAHYMVCNKSYDNGSVEGYKKDIKDAQSAGIDGFALNLGAWNKNYKKNVENIFQAAKELNSDFKLFFSPDRCCGLKNFQIIEMLKIYVNHQSYYYYNNRPFLSAYSGAARPDWWKKAVFLPLDSAGLSPYFVPYLFPINQDPTPDSSNLAKRYHEVWQHLIDGYFLFGAAGLPRRLTESGEYASKLMHANGKTYMATVSPYYWGNKQKNSGRRYFEYLSGEGLETQWKSIINNQKPEWVELVTWNDWDEGTYFSPIEDINKHWKYNASNNLGFYKSHKGYTELNKYFINWYKSGQKPVIQKDQLFIFYRTHPHELEAKQDPKGQVKNKVGRVNDEIFLTALLTDNAKIIVNSGKEEIEIEAARGLHHFRVPFNPGQQTFVLYRKGKKILSGSGENIEEQISEYNFNIYSFTIQ